MTLKSIAKKALFFALAIVFGCVMSLGAWPTALVEGNVIQIINRSNDGVDRVFYVDELDSSKDARHQKTLSMSGTISRDDLRTYFIVAKVSQPYIWFRSAKYPSELIRHNVATTNLAEVPTDLQFTLQSLPYTYTGSDFMNNLAWERLKIVNDTSIMTTAWDGNPATQSGYVRAASDFGGNPQLLSTKSHLGSGYETDWAYSLAFVPVPTVPLPDAIKEGNIITMNTPRGYVVVDGAEGKWLSFDAAALPTDLRTQFRVARVEGSYFWLQSVKYPSELIRHTPKGDNKGADYTVGSAVPNQPYSGTDWTNNLRWERFRLDKGKYIMTTRWDGSQTEPGGYIRARGSSFNLIRTHNDAINDYASLGEAFTFAVATVPAPAAVIPAGVATGKNVAIKLTADGSYLSTPGAWVEATGTKDIKAVGVPFVVTVNSDNSLSFMAQNGKYLSALDIWVLSAEATTIGDREKFIFSDNKLYSVGMHAYVTKTIGTDIRTHAPTDVANYLRAQAINAVALSIVVIAPAGTGMIWATLTDGRVVFREGVTATAPGGTGWSVVAGTLVKIAVGWDSQVYGVQSGGQTWYRTNVTANALGGTDWAQFPGVSAVSITAGPNGTLWHCVGDGKAYFGLYSGAINSVGAWEPVHNTLAKISAGPNGHVFALDTTGKILYRTGISSSNLKGTDWYTMPGTNAASITAGPNGCAWALKSDQTVWFLKDINSSWTQIPDCWGTSISAAADGSVWMSQASGDVWMRLGITSNAPMGTVWTKISNGSDFNVACIAAGPVAPIMPAPTIATTVAPNGANVNDAAVQTLESAIRAATTISALGNITVPANIAFSTTTKGLYVDKLNSFYTSCKALPNATDSVATLTAFVTVAQNQVFAPLIAGQETVVAGWATEINQKKTGIQSATNAATAFDTAIKGINTTQSVSAIVTALNTILQTAPDAATILDSTKTAYKDILVAASNATDKDSLQAALGLFNNTSLIPTGFDVTSLKNKINEKIAALDVAVKAAADKTEADRVAAELAAKAATKTEVEKAKVLEEAKKTQLQKGSGATRGVSAGDSGKGVLEKVMSQPKPTVPSAPVKQQKGPEKRK